MYNILIRLNCHKKNTDYIKSITDKSLDRAAFDLNQLARDAGSISKQHVLEKTTLCLDELALHGLSNPLVLSTSKLVVSRTF